MTSRTDKRFLSKKELSELLGLSIFTIDAWVSQKREIPYVKLGKRVIFDIEDVLRWIETRKVNPNDTFEEN